MPAARSHAALARALAARVLRALLAVWLAARHAAKAAFRAAVAALPAEVRYVLSVLAFWPTALLNRAVCAVTNRRRLWDRVDGTLVLGSVPLLAADVRALHRDLGVRGVVNMCREWRWHAPLYAGLGVDELHVPTIDYDLPTLAGVVSAAAFIRAHEARGESVYVHCKAGRGRSTAVVLCYLVLFRGMTPQAADAVVRAARPQVSVKWRGGVVQHCAAHRAAVVRDVEALLARGGGGGEAADG